MSEMVESTITSHTYVAHVPVPSQKEVNLHLLGVTVATLLQNKIDRKQVNRRILLLLSCFLSIFCSYHCKTACFSFLGLVSSLSIHSVTVFRVLLECLYKIF